MTNEDIADFFPSTTETQVHDIWQHFFRFPAEVAAYLTGLTTRDGELPQGAKTSSCLANLVFWRTEFEFVRYLESEGCAYSRLADDITVSAAMSLARGEISTVMSLVYSFTKRIGYTPKYRKHAIFNRNERMLVNNLVVNVRAALPISARQTVRGLVYRTKRTIKNEGTSAISATKARGGLNGAGRSQGTSKRFIRPILAACRNLLMRHRYRCKPDRAMTSLALRHDGFGYQNCGESHRARAGNRLISAAEDAGETYCIDTAKFEHVYEPDPDAGSADSAQLRGT